MEMCIRDRVYAESCRIDREQDLKYDNVTYGGPFKNADKPELYKSVDMIHLALIHI